MTIMRRPAGKGIQCWRLLATLAAGLSLTACAIHPVPEDVTGVNTFEIVRQIRCETRKAVFDAAIYWLLHDEDADPASRRIGIRFAETQDISHFNPSLFQGRDRRIFEYFWGTGVAYNYDLQMTEVNAVAGEFNLLKPNFLSNNKLGLKAGIDLQRQNTRTFTITDTFGSLLAHVPNDYCEGRIASPNYMYPIAGRIGMDRVIDSFVNLTLHAKLAGDPKAAGGPPTMVDTLIFTTTLSGALTPKLTFSPVGQGWQTSDSSVAADVKRQDLHKLTVGLSVAKSAVPETEPLRSALFGRLLTASGGASEQAAATAVDQALTSKLFQQNINVYQ